MNDCIFFRIINRDIHGSIVYEDQDLFAFLDIQPVYPGHTLIVPKKHDVLISEMIPEIIGKLFIMGAKIGSAIRGSKTKCRGMDFFLADGEEAG
jgi:histidine triad (HIT) family protein